MPRCIANALLEYCRRNSGRLITREELAENVWRLKMVAKSRTIDVTMSFVRKSLTDGERIETVRGSGYRYTSLDETASDARSLN